MKILNHKKIIVLAIISLVVATTNLVYCQTQQIEKPLPKKAKLKTIKYKSFGYAATGYILEKQFVDGQKISFHSTSTEKEIIPFTVLSANKTELSNPILSGTYFIKDGISYLESTIKNREWEYEIQGIFKISNTRDNKTLTVNRNDAKSLDIEIVDIIKCSGNYQYGEYPASIQKQSDNNYALNVEFRDRTLQTSIKSDYLKKTFFPVVNNLFKNTEYSNTTYFITLNFDDYIQNSEDVRLAFENGDVFTGQVEKDDYSYYNAKQGEYRYSNGEIFTGDFTERHNWYSEKIPIGGQMKFTDGSVEDGNWLKKYNVKEEALVNAKTLTEKHNLAIRLYEGEQQKLRKQKIANQQEEERKRIAEQRLQNSLINKYGNYWGKLIYNREFTPGMTKEMVLEFTSEKIYKISKAIRNGDNIEIWEFDQQKLAQEMIKEEGEDGAMTLLALSLMENLGMGNINSQFPTLVFTNNKLTDVYQN